MNLDERLARYLERDFGPERAQILALMEEAAVAIFAALPEHFVMFGGATLVLFRNSPRLSSDLDLPPEAIASRAQKSSKMRLTNEYKKSREFSVSVR